MHRVQHSTYSLKTKIELYNERFILHTCIKKHKKRKKKKEKKKKKSISILRETVLVLILVNDVYNSQTSNPQFDPSKLILLQQIDELIQQCMMAHCATINFVINNKLLNFEFNNQVIVTSSHLEKKSYEFFNMLSLNSLTDMIYNETSFLILKIIPLKFQDIF